MKEWKVLLDKVVDDNTIMYYTVDAQGCSEFYVSVFFTNDPDITDTRNGRIAVNADASPWSTGIKVSGNIQNLAYAEAGNNNKAVVLGFELAAGLLIPTRSFGSYNAGGSSASLVPVNSLNFNLNIDTDKTELSYRPVEEIQNVSVGGYGKYFGAGSKILILGR